MLIHHPNFSTFVALIALIFGGTALFSPSTGKTLATRETETAKNSGVIEKETELTRNRDQIRNRTQWNQPEHVAGHEQCAQCHREETKTWLNSHHGSVAFDRLRTSEKALRYARKLGIRSEDIASNSLCTNCHGTPQQYDDGRLNVIPGVSCEACHSAAGGDAGWLNMHAVYGSANRQRERETYEHFMFRKQRVRQAGQLGPSNLYGLVKRCFDCHVTGDELLAEAGHDQGEAFEFVLKSKDDFLHNFIVDENHNAPVSSLWLHPVYGDQSRLAASRLRVMFVLGQMVDLEVSFRNLARATDENQLSDSMMARIENAYVLLGEEVLPALDDSNDSPAVKHIQKVVDVVQDTCESLCDDGFDIECIDDYLKAANAIAKIAKAFAQCEGCNLEALDELGLISPR